MRTLISSLIRSRIPPFRVMAYTYLNRQRSSESPLSTFFRLTAVDGGVPGDCARVAALPSRLHSAPDAQRSSANTLFFVPRTVQPQCSTFASAGALWPRRAVLWCSVQSPRGGDRVSSARRCGTAVGGAIDSGQVVGGARAAPGPRIN